MENRANYALVGVFTLAVIAAAFGFVYWFKRSAENGDRQAFRVVFTGSVSGLSRGSVVRFNGLRVGEVTAIEIMRSDPGKVVATIEVERHTPMKTDTRARLESQGLTGVSSIQLSGGTADAPDLVSPDPAGRPVIFADRSDYQDILETVQRLSGKVDSVLTRADTLLAQSEGSILSTVKNVEAFSQALADNSSGINAFLANIGEMSQKVGSLSGRIERFVDEAEATLRAIDSAGINRAVNNVADFSDALAKNRANIDAMLSDAAQLAKSLNASTGRLDSALDEIARVARALDDRKIAGIVDGGQKFAETLGRNAEALDRSFRDVSDITAKVSQAANRLDNVLAGAEKFLGSGDDGQAQGMMAEISETARAIRTLAANLDKRTGEITAGINRFTGPGLRDLEALVAETKKTVGDLGRTARSLERNPQQLLFGGRSNIPEYRR
ncbi:MAG: MlaD family protein [Hyphomicrobiales bacterium]|uniref:MlaD family protein n=1 Tax=Rhabdaerophilum calidifontis TaxID=2604328 RepID=UPI001238E269|nr:MCE family protein [Rhabdaerophilum calidifontis]MCA1952178.1 MlaD family protein [Hyphomicrobiales bacterium]MCA1999628.1 MlaD family protein [Hyphomicrobiales bacterium]